MCLGQSRLLNRIDQFKLCVGKRNIWAQCSCLILFYMAFTNGVFFNLTLLFRAGYRSQSSETGLYMLIFPSKKLTLGVLCMAPKTFIHPKRGNEFAKLS